MRYSTLGKDGGVYCISGNTRQLEIFTFEAIYSQVVRMSISGDSIYNVCNTQYMPCINMRSNFVTDHFLGIRAILFSMTCMFQSNGCFILFLYHLTVKQEWRAIFTCVLRIILVMYHDFTATHSNVFLTDTLRISKVSIRVFKVSESITERLNR